MHAETSVNQIITRIGGLQHIKFFHRRDVILVVLAGHVVDFHVHKMIVRTGLYFTIVKAGVGEIKLRVSDAKFFGVEFCLLRDDLFNQPTNRARVRLQTVRQNLFIRDVKRRQDFEQPAEQVFNETQFVFNFLDLDFAHKISLNEILAGSISFSQRKFLRQPNELFQAQFLRAFLRRAQLKPSF
jgi:hypothetical protein